MPNGDLVLDALLGHADTPSPAVADEAVRRAQAGDMEAFAALMARHRVRVLRVALRLLGNREDAQDAAQESSSASIAASTGSIRHVRSRPGSTGSR